MNKKIVLMKKMNYLYVQIELFLRSFELFLSPLNFFMSGH